MKTNLYDLHGIKRMNVYFAHVGGKLFGYFFMRADAEDAAKDQGWRGACGTVEQIPALQDVEGNIYLLRQQDPIPVTEMGRGSSFAQLSPSGKRAFGVKEGSQ